MRREACISSLTRRDLLIAAAATASALLAACTATINDAHRGDHAGGPLARPIPSPTAPPAVPSASAPSALSTQHSALPLVASAAPGGDPFPTDAFGMVGVFDVDWLADPSFARFLDHLAASPGAFTAMRFFGSLNSGTKEKTTPGEGSGFGVRGSKKGADSSNREPRTANLSRFSPALAGLAALTSRGLVPFVQLSFFPADVSSSPVLPPASLADWQTLVTDFLAALADDPRFGPEAMRTWWFEVWNEPNIPAFWQGTFDQYLDLYRATSAAVRASGYAVRLGGPTLAWLPATDPAAGAPLMQQFLQFLHDAPAVQCDFLSFHEKGTWVSPSLAQGSDEPALGNLARAADEVARMAQMICPERCGNLTIINNEADMKVGFDVPYEPRMTERFPAWLSGTLVAYDALNARYRESGIRFSAAADDANLQLVEAPFDGRRAVMTRATTTPNGDLFKLPVYHFYELLRLLGNRHGAITVGGEGCYPATDLFHLLTVADDHLGALFTVYPTDIAAAETRTVDYTITDMPWPVVNIARFQIDATHSNAYTAAGARLSIPPPDATTARAIRQAQELALFAPIVRQVTVTRGTFRDRFAITPFTTLLYWITPSLPDTPAALQQLAATREGGNVILRWQPSRESSFFSYEVSLMTVSGPGALLSPVPLRAALWVDTAPPPDARTYGVRAVSASGVAGPPATVRV